MHRFITASCSSRHAHLVIPAIAVALLSYRVDTLPGYHGDEAWVVLRALREISRGIVTWEGMNHYTGSLFHILVTPFMMLFGFTPLVSRWCAIALNAIALVFTMKSAGLLTRSRFLMLATGLWTLTLPAFLLDSRFAVEVCALNPLLDSLAIYALALCFTEENRRHALGLAAVSGSLFAGAAYSHGSGLYLPASIAFSALLVYRAAFFRNPRCWAAGLGFVSVFLAFAFLRGWKRHAGSLYQKFLGDLLSPERLRDLTHLPRALMEGFDGVALFKRYLGSPDPVHVPVFLLALALLAGIAWENRRVSALKKENAFFLLTWLIGVVFTALSAPYLATNYFHIWQVTLPLVLFSALPWSDKSEAHLPARIKLALLAGIPLLQLVNLGTQYYAEFDRHGIRPLVYPIGERLYETSNHFLPTCPLQDQLHQAGISHVAGDQLLMWNLEVCSLKNVPVTTTIVDFPEQLRAHSFNHKTAFVAYNANHSIGGKFHLPFAQIPYRSGSGIFIPAPEFGGHFAVWIFDPQNASAAAPETSAPGQPANHQVADSGERWVMKSPVAAN